MSGFYLAAPLLASASAALLLVIVLRARRHTPVHWTFALMLLAMVLWGTTIFGMRSTQNLYAALIWEKVVLIVILGVPFSFFHFTRIFVRQTGRMWLVYLTAFSSLFAIALVILGPAVTAVEKTWYGNAPRFGALFPLYLFVVYLPTFLGIRNLAIFYFETTSRISKSRTIYILLGVGCSLAGGVYDSLPFFENQYPLGVVSNLLFAFFVAVAIFKHNLLDVRLVIQKSFVYSAVSAIILSAYILILFLLNLVFQNRTSALSWPINLVALLGVAVLLKPLLDRVQRLTDRWFSRRRSDYLRALEDLSNSTKNVTDFMELTDMLEQFLRTTTGAKKVVVLASSDKGTRFTSVSGRPVKSTGQLVLERPSTILAWLRAHNEILRLEDIQTLPQFLAISGRELAILEEFSVKIFVPIKKRQQLEGILVLSGKRSEEEYSDEDAEFLRAVANHVAIVVERARLFASVVSQRARLRSLLERAIRAQEDERKRLSIELHDSPVQLLTSALYLLEASLDLCRKGELEQLSIDLHNVRGILDKTLEELRHSAAALHPPELEKVGLVKALRRYATSFQSSTGILTDFEDVGLIPRFPPAVDLAVYRIVQEALSNVRKHSNASAVELRLEARERVFKLVVRDNGVGFDVDQSKPNADGHLGLAGMEERAYMLGGTLSILSAPLAGTTVTLIVPFTDTPKTLEQRAKATKVEVTA